MTAVEAHTRSFTHAAAFREVPPFPDGRATTPHEYTVEKLHPEDPLLLVWPKLDRDEMFLCLVLRLRGGVAGMQTQPLFEAMRTAARASGTVIVRAEIKKIVYTTRLKFTKDQLPLTIDNIARAGKPALYRFSDAERWTTPQAQETIDDQTQQARGSEPRMKGMEVTPTQKRVLDLLAVNLSVTQIARELNTSRGSVYVIIEKLQRITGAVSREALGRFAREQKDHIAVSQPVRTRRPPSSTQQRAVRGPASTAERTMPTEVREPFHPVLVNFALSLVQHKLSKPMRLMSNDPQVALREAVPESDVFLEKIAQGKTKAEVDTTIVSSLIKILEWAWVAKHGRTFDEQNLLLHLAAIR